MTAPSATSSWSWMGEILAPQLSEPTNRKCPVRLDFLAACRTRLKEDKSGESPTEALMDGNGRLVTATHLMSSSLAKMMTPRALEVSISLLMILSNSPGFGSLGILMDCAIQRPPKAQTWAL